MYRGSCGGRSTSTRTEAREIAEHLSRDCGGQRPARRPSSQGSQRSSAIGFEQVAQLWGLVAQHEYQEVVRECELRELV